MNHSLTTSSQQILSNRDNRFFIILMCLIRQRHVTTSTQLEEAIATMPAFPDIWRHIANDLLAACQNGEEIFWLSYDIQALDYPPLAQWRSLVAQSASVLLSDIPPSSQKPSVVISFQNMPDPHVDWLWEPRLPLGMFTVLDGDPVLDKSMLAIDLAARVSSGLPMPDGSPALPAPAGVVIITAEDNPYHTLRPRLLHAGADLSRVFMLNKIPLTDPTTGYTYHRNFLLSDDLPRLEQAIDQSQARLLIIDPITVLFGNKDTYRYSEAFTHLSLLHELLAKKQTACLLLRHLNRGAANNPLYRGLASISFTGLPRTELMVVNDPCDDHLSLLVHMESNISPLAPTLRFSLSRADPATDSPLDSPADPPDTNDLSVSWHGTSPYSSQDATHSMERKLGALRTDILRVLQQHAPYPFSPLEMAKQLPNVPFNTLRVTLRRMAIDEQIEQPVRGQYCLTTS